jgi:hypothetical protein
MPEDNTSTNDLPENIPYDDALAPIKTSFTLPTRRSLKESLIAILLIGIAGFIYYSLPQLSSLYSNISQMSSEPGAIISYDVPSDTDPPEYEHLYEQGFFEGPLYKVNLDEQTTAVLVVQGQVIAIDGRELTIEAGGVSAKIYVPDNVYVSIQDFSSGNEFSVTTASFSDVQLGDIVAYNPGGVAGFDAYLGIVK